MNENKNAVLSVTCPSIRGVTADIVSYLASKGCNIRDSAQFDDESTDRYFMRITFRSEEGRSLAELEKEFEPVASKYSMQCRFFEEQSRLRVVLMVSRFGHCLNDLLFRWKIGALPIDIVGVISNHTDFQALVESHAIPYHHIPVTKENKPDAEAAQMRVVRDTQAELIVLARYMQVLSDEMCQQMSCRIINIHHSFLPSFKGGNPYHQAFRRGVKLIGATSHYVTADLDEGPIIEQDTVRITHAQSAADYVALGRDVENVVLARAIHAHVHGRVFINGDKTIVFPPSPDSYTTTGSGQTMTHSS